MSFLVNTKSLVPGEGPVTLCEIAFVGECPGAAEEQQGRPFVGPSGTLLTDLMHKAMISRSDVYLTNVVKERPHNNDISSLIDVAHKGGPIVTEEFKSYVELLREELEFCSANVIVAVGAVALFALTGRQHVQKYRGSILESTLLPGRKVIPIIHPASALREYLFRYYISFDLKRIREEATTPHLNLPERELIVAPDFIQVMGFLGELLEAGNSPEGITTGADIEVTNEEVSCISFTTTPQRAISIPFTREGRNDYFTIDQEIAVWNLIEQVLLHTNIKKVWQNGAFDRTFLHDRYGLISYNNEDTMIAQAIAYPDLPKGLDFISSVYTREPYYKDEGKKHFKFGGNLHDFWRYNAKDSAVTVEAFGPLMKDIARLKNTDIYETQNKLVEPLVYMAIRGVKVNLNAREAASKIALEKANEAQERLSSIAGFALNPNSSKQLIEYFYEKKKVKAYVNRKTGAPTVDVNALKRLVRLGFEEAKLIQEIRKQIKLNSTYLEMELDDDGRIRCSFNPVGTSSLRLSSSKTIFDKGGNMQNLPYEVRQFIEADEGYVCYQMDLSQAENREVAYIAPEPAMIEAFETGRDIHRQTAALIFGKPVDEISDDDGSCSIGGGMHSERYWGKKANHGLNYDLGYKTFAFYYEIPEAEAKFICDAYHRAYPGVRRYHAWVRAALQKDRTLTNCHGWRRLFLDRWDDTLFKLAYSFMPQSDIAAKLNRSGIIYPYYELKSSMEIINQVHDSVWFQIPVSVGWKEHARLCILVRQSLEEPLTWRGNSFSIPVDTEIGMNFGKFNPNAKTEEGKNKKGLRKLKFKPSLNDVEALAKLLEEQYNKMTEVPDGPSPG